MCGYSLGSLARRTVLINGILFCLVASYFELAARPVNRRYDYSVTGGIFPLVFYRAIFPLMLLGALVLIQRFSEYCEAEKGPRCR
jgi:hypothetical protein